MSNPYGANQYLLDPRQLQCWENYINPKSETFGKITKSAIKAGYDDEYAEQISSSEWFIVKMRRLNMLSKAEKVLDEYLEMEDKEFNNEGVEKRNPALSKIKQDTAKFVAERIGKAEGYSTRNELTGADGKDLPTPILGNNYVSTNNITTKGVSNDKKNKGGARRDISE